MQKFVQFRSILPGVSGAPGAVYSWSLRGSRSTSEPATQIEVSPTVSFVQQSEVSTDAARRTLHDLFRALTRQPQRVSSTEIRQHFSDTIEWVVEADRALIVTNHGRPEAVVLSSDAFERLVKALARAVLALGVSGSSLGQQAEDILEEEGAALARRFRHGDAG